MNEPREMSLILNRLDELARLIQGKHVSPWMTVKEASDYLRCSPRKIESLTARSLLPYKRQDPTSAKSPRLYHRKHLTAFIITGKNPIRNRLSPEEKRQVQELL